MKFWIWTVVPFRTCNTHGPLTAAAPGPVTPVTQPMFPSINPAVLGTVRFRGPLEGIEEIDWGLTFLQRYISQSFGWSCLHSRFPAKHAKRAGLAAPFRMVLGALLINLAIRGLSAGLARRFAAKTVSAFFTLVRI